MKLILIVFSVLWFTAHPSMAFDKKKNDSELASSLSSLQKQQDIIPQSMTIYEQDKHTEDFRNKFNDLPPAVKLSFLVNAFKKNHHK